MSPTSTTGSAGPLSARRSLGDRGFQVLTPASGLLVLLILLLIAGSTTGQAWSWFDTEGWGIFATVWDPAADEFGALAFMYARPSPRRSRS